jgi:hypothetical protein
MTGAPRPLTAAQLKAARLLAEGANGITTAAAVGVRPETLSRWHRLPAFAAELRRLVERAHGATTTERVEALTGPALDVLERVVLANTAPDPLRVHAAALLAFAASIAPHQAGDGAASDRTS